MEEDNQKASQEIRALLLNNNQFIGFAENWRRYECAMGLISVKIVPKKDNKSTWGWRKIILYYTLLHLELLSTNHFPKLREECKWHFICQHLKVFYNKKLIKRHSYEAYMVDGDAKCVPCFRRNWGEIRNRTTACWARLATDANRIDSPL